MKNTSRLLALILAALMVLSIVVFAEDTSGTVSEDILKKFELFQAFAISDTVGIDLQKQVTRAEFANIAANMLGLKKDIAGKLGEGPFIDIQSNPFFRQIQALVDLGILSGVNAYQFKPDGTIGYQAAVSVLVSVLGYKQLALASGGYPYGYLAVANRLGILPKNNRNLEVLTWAEVVELVMNCTDVEILMISSVGDDIQYDTQKGKNFLSQYHNIEKVKGRMSDNGITSLTSSSAIGKTSVKIGDMVIQEGKTNAKSYLGREVIAYYQEDDSSCTMLHIERNASKDESLEIAAADIVSTQKTSIVYLKNDKSKTVRIDRYADVIYNNAAYPDFDATTFQIKNGKLTLIDSKNSGVYDLVLAEEFDTCFVSTTNTQRNIIYGQYGEVIDMGQYSYQALYNMDGKGIEFTSIKANAVVSIYASKQKEAVRIVMTEQSVIGTVTDYSTDQDGHENYTVKQIEYQVSKSLQDALKKELIGMSPPEIGGDYVFYLDIENHIAGLTRKETGAYYAYAKEVSDQKGLGNEDRAIVRMLLSTGDFITARTAKKIYINQSVKSVKGSGLLQIPDLFKDGVFVPQLIKVKLNASGEIGEIETAGAFQDNGYGYNAEKFSKTYKSSASIWRYSNRTFEAKYAFYTDTPIFKVPLTDKSNESLYEVVKPSALSLSTAIQYNIEIYDVDATLSGKACVMYEDKGNPAYDNELFVVDTIVKTIDEKDQAVYRIRGYQNRAYWELTESAEGIVDAASPSLFKRGDVLQIQSDKTGKKLKAAKLIASLSTMQEPSYKEISGTFATGVLVTMYGPIYAKSSAAVSVLTSYDSPSILACSPSSTTMVVLYNVKQNELKLVKYEDIPATSIVAKDGSITPDKDIMIFIQRANSYMETTVVVNRK